MSTDLRCYTIKQICEFLQVKLSTFNQLRREGKLPFLEELRPRLGHPRYRADLIDKYLAGQWGQPENRFFGRRSR